MKSPNAAPEQTDRRKRLPFLIMTVCLVLVVGICVTIALLGERLKSVAPDDSGVIDLMDTTPAPSEPQGGSNGGSTDTPAPSEPQSGAEGGSTGAPAPSEPQSGAEGGSTGAPAPSEPQSGAEGGPTDTPAPSQPSETVAETHPDFSAEDAQQVWETETAVDIFKISYDETGEITVQSAGGDKVLAPGTANSYTFTFKNNGDVALDYTVSFEAFVTPGEIALPIQAKMNRYDGTYLVGGKGEWAPVLNLNGVTDAATLGVSQYANYTLDWQWPFETVDENGWITAGDAYDTWLGNLAADEDISLTIRVHVVSTISSGESPPFTGDSSHIQLSAVLALTSGTMLILLPVVHSRKRRTDDE